jgi:hypothetical protein
MILQAADPGESAYVITDGTYTIRLTLAGQPKVYGGRYPQAGEWWMLIIRQEQVVCGRLVTDPAFLPWQIVQSMLQLTAHQSLFDTLPVATAIPESRDAPESSAESASTSSLPPPPAAAVTQPVAMPAASSIDGAKLAILGTLTRPKQGAEVKAFLCGQLSVSELAYGMALGQLIFDGKVTVDDETLTKKT